MLCRENKHLKHSCPLDDRVFNASLKMEGLGMESNPSTPRIGLKTPLNFGDLEPLVALVFVGGIKCMLFQGSYCVGVGNVSI